ncbi:DNA-binding protein [Sulfolobus acidocaldarius SUSAZ]|nr:DNA-binding protein [Sulfolobus acidocaldarius SUSAZ]
MSWEKEGKEGSLLKWYDIMEAEKYEYTVGPAGERFFQGLKENKIIGSKCKKCGKVYLPPRIYCEDCFTKIEEYVELKLDDAYLDSFTTIYQDDDGQKLAEPVHIGLLRFKGVNGGLFCYLEGTPKKGGRIRVSNFNYPLRISIE